MPILYIATILPSLWCTLLLCDFGTIPGLVKKEELVKAIPDNLSILP